MERDKERLDKLQKEKDKAKPDREKLEREKQRQDKERLDKLMSEKERIDRDIERLNRDRERLEKAKSKLETKTTERPSKSNDSVIDRAKVNSREVIKKNIDLKSQNTYRIDKNANEKKFNIPSKNSNDSKYTNGHSSQGKPVLKSKDQIPQKNGFKERVSFDKNRASDDRVERQQPSKELTKRTEDRRVPSNTGKTQSGNSKPSVANSFDFDKHVSSLGKNGHSVSKNDLKKPNGSRQFPPADVRRKPHPDDIRKKQKS